MNTRTEYIVGGTLSWALDLVEENNIQNWVHVTDSEQLASATKDDKVILLGYRGLPLEWGISMMLALLEREGAEVWRIENRVWKVE